MNMNKKGLLSCVLLCLVVASAQGRLRPRKKGYLIDSIKTMMGINEAAATADAIDESNLQQEVAPTFSNSRDPQKSPVEPVLAEAEEPTPLTTQENTQDNELFSLPDVSNEQPEQPQQMQDESFNRVQEPVVEEQAEPVVPVEDKSYDRQTEQDLMKLGNQGFDEPKRRKEVIDMVQKAIAYLKDHSLDDSLDAFDSNPAFINGELHLNVFDTKGTCYAHGIEPELIWHNLIDLKDQYNIPILQNMIKKASAGGGWTIYSWRGATQVSYCQQLLKDGVTYIVSCGYYPHSKADQVVGLVKGAVGEFNELVGKLGKSTDVVFSSYSYPLGRFAIGDLYLYVLDFKGTIYAQGDRPGLIGTNALNYQDSKGKFANQEIIKKLKDVPAGTGVWVKYFSKNAPKLTYAEKVVDNQKKEYFIACGYYPTVTREKAVDLAKSAYDYLKRQGKLRAFAAFNSKRDDTFRYGDLTVSVLTPEGEIVANGDQPETVGVNIYDVTDEEGAYFAREIIAKALSGGGWSTYRVRNSFQSSYCELVQVGLDKYIVLVSLYPVSKQETALLLLKAAVGLLETTDALQTLRSLTKKTGTFIRGDLFVEVYDQKGICLAAGTNYDLIWKNMLNAKDDQGKPYIRLLINSVRRGPARLSYRIRGANRMAFAEQVEKDDKNYILVTGYYN